MGAVYECILNNSIADRRGIVIAFNQNRKPKLANDYHRSHAQYDNDDLWHTRNPGCVSNLLLAKGK